MCSVEHYGSFLIHSWFCLMHNSIPSWSTNRFFSHLPNAQFADCITYLTTQRILFWFLQTITFLPFCTCLSFIMFGDVSFPVSHLFAIFASKCASSGSTEQPTSIFLVAWPAHNLLIASPASPHRKFCLGFHRKLHFWVFTYIWVLICMNMFHPHFQCFGHHSIPVYSHRLSRTIHRHILVTWPAQNSLFASPASP